MCVCVRACACVRVCVIERERESDGNLDDLGHFLWEQRLISVLLPATIFVTMSPSSPFTSLSLFLTPPPLPPTYPALSFICRLSLCLCGVGVLRG